LGRFERERAYQKAVAGEMKREGLAFKEQVPVKVFFSEDKVAQYFLDFVVENLVVIELKASNELFDARYLDQLQAYLCSSNLPLGLLVNFRSLRLKPIRILNPHLSSLDFSAADAGFKSTGRPLVVHKIR
jgi:GxxExxY protein